MEQHIKMLYIINQDINLNSNMKTLMTLAYKYNLPVIFHTGYTKGKGRKEAYNPMNLIFFIQEYHYINFVIAHLGNPFINEMIKYAGGRNIAADMNKDYFNCSVEWIITSNPDIIICPAMKTGREADVIKRKGWQNISAVKNNRIYVDLDDDLVYRLGPRIIEGVKLLKKIISF